MLRIPNSIPWKGRNATTLPNPRTDSKPMPQGTHTGAATPITAPTVPDLLILPLTTPLDLILKIINEIVTPKRMLIKIKIAVACKRPPVIPSLYKPKIKLKYSGGLVFVNNVNINLKFFDRILNEKNMNAILIVIKKYFFLESILFTEVQA